VPDDPEEEVDYHHICFASGSNGHVYELDGDRNGPVDRDVLLGDGGDMMGEDMLAHIRAFTRRYEHENMSFNLMVLTEAKNWIILVMA
jgi:ubiquitin carboxyl-terminal hydrolase L3